MPAASPGSAFRLSSFVFRRWVWFRLLVHLACLVPFALLVWDGAHNHLTANPIQEITYRTGRNALKLLLVTLACTPAANLLGFKAALLVRRPLGLYAFFYACLHFLTFGVDYGLLDTGLDWLQIEKAIVEKRYILVGFAAFLCLIPLTLTSTKGWQRRLRRRWFALHRLAYVAGVLAIIHFVWLVKADVRRPLQYGAVLAALLLLRVPALRRAARRFQGQRRVRQATAVQPRQTAAT
jgi:sulfoxide reductase heme-binding subunit YedZ